MVTRTFRESEKTTTKPVSFLFFRSNFIAYTDVDNRERARASDKKQRRRISLEEKHETFVAAVRK